MIRCLRLILVLAAVLAVPGGAGAAENGLARTPYMGWNSYYALGTSGGPTELAVTSMADAIVARGLRDAGYRYVWIDAGWRSGPRAKHGAGLRVDHSRWPHGMAWVAAYLHARGLLAGIYTDAGRDGCGLPNGGSYGHYARDVNQFAAWGFDAIKVDFCGGHGLGLDPVRAYNRFAFAVAHNAAHRPLLLNICNFYQPGQDGPANPSFQRSAYFSYAYAPPISNSWRTDTDLGYPGNVPFDNVLRNLDEDAQHPTAAGPGHWNDPDYLAPEMGMSPQEFQGQFTMWAELSAPLMLGNDVRAMTPATQSTVTNRDVIAVDQDPLGKQGVRVAREGLGEVWSKQLADGSRAVVLLNRSPDPLAIAATAAQAGLPPAASYTVRDLWTGASTQSDGALLASVPGHDAYIYRVTPQA